MRLSNISFSSVFCGVVRFLVGTFRKLSLSLCAGEKMNKINKQDVAYAWFFSGLEDLFFAFQIHSPFRYEPFISTMGFEKVCKAYLLSEKSSEYDTLEREEAKKEIDSLAKDLGHKLKRMVNEIKDSVHDQEFERLINQDFDGYTGKTLIKVMEAAYLECRYPVPKHINRNFPIKGESGMYWEPICSSGIQKFCFAFTGRIMIYLKENLDIPISKDEFDKIITGKDGVRFCNLFLKYNPENIWK